MGIKFCDEENATIFSRKAIKKIASENGLIAERDFQKKRVDGGWKAFSRVEIRRKGIMHCFPEIQTLFWCA